MLYLSECIALVPADSHVLVRRRGRAFRVRRAADALQFGRKALILLPLIPGSGAAHVLRAWPGTAAAELPDAVSIEEAIAARFHLPSFEARVREVATASRMSGLVGLMLFAIVFVASPVLFAIGHLLPLWPYLVAIALVLHAVAIAVRVRAERRLFGKEAGRAGLIFKLAISPLGSMRAGDALALRGLSGFEPVVAAWVLGDAAAFLRVARETLARTRTCAADERLAAAVPVYQARLHRFLRIAGVRSGQLDLPEDSRDASIRSYCPACRAEYVVLSGACTDCGATLVPVQSAQVEAHADLRRRSEARRRRRGMAR